MIVFPLIRSAGLKAAMASSRAATLPMFARSRPCRTRWATSLNWARSGTTTKSIVRPPGGPRLGRAGDGHQRSTGANQARRPLSDVAADDIENQIDFADVFQGVVIEVDKLLCAEAESR